MADTPLRSDEERLPPEFRSVLRQIHERGPDPYCGFEELLCEMLRAALSAQVEQPSGEAGKCHHGWHGTAIDGQIQTPCPACGAKSLFIGEGGHLTCARVPNDHNDGCHSPSVEQTVNDLKAEVRALHAGHAKRDASPQPSSEPVAAEARKMLDAVVELLATRSDRLEAFVGNILTERAEALRAVLVASPQPQGEQYLAGQLCPKCGGDCKGAPCAYPEDCGHPCREYVAERNQALIQVERTRHEGIHAGLEKAAEICESRAGSQATGAFRILMSAAEAIRAYAATLSQSKEGSRGRRLIYNKQTKKIDVVRPDGLVTDSFAPPQEQP